MKEFEAIHYAGLRAAGLSICWMGFLGLAVLKDSPSTLLIIVASLLVVLGLALYLAAISWDLLLPPNR